MPGPDLKSVVPPFEPSPPETVPGSGAPAAVSAPAPGVGDPGGPAAPPSRLTPRLALALILLQSVIYGFGDPISKVAYEVVPVLALLSVRYLLALALILLFAGKRVLAGLRRCRVRDWLAPTLCIAAAHVVGNAGLLLTAATSSAFLRSLSTVMTPLLALLLFRRRYSWKHLPIQLAVVLGLYLLCGRGGLNGFGMGEALSLLSALLLAGTLVLGQRSLFWVDPVTLTAVQTAASAVLGTVCAFALDGGWSSLSAATPTVWSVIVYLSLGCTVGGYLLQNAALTALPDRTVALAQCTGPVMTALFSFFVLGERLSPAGLAGAAVIVACVAAESLLPQPPLASREEMS